MKSPKNMLIGVFFGGRSPEHDVSIITGELILSELRNLGYHVVPVYIDKKGRWFSNEKIGHLKFFTDGNFESELDRMQMLAIELDTQNNALVLINRGFMKKKIVLDLAFPAFHGMNGEDGTVQGLFELSNIPYVGCEVACSAMTMDKVITKQMYQSAEIQTTPFIFFSDYDWKCDKSLIIEKSKKLHWPIFVKPARLGSSIGITKVSDIREFSQACEVALHFDSRVIIEEGVENLMDITCAVLGNYDPVASLVQESVFQGDHFSYEAKYLEDGGAQLGNAQNSIVIPARISEKMTQEVRDMATKIFALFGCCGMARIDFLHDTKGEKIYANEVNTLPGTLYHHLWKASGIQIQTLLEKLLDFALERHKEKNMKTLTFASSILHYAGSVKLRMKG